MHWFFDGNAVLAVGCSTVFYGAMLILELHGNMICLIIFCTVCRWETLIHDGKVPWSADKSLWLRLCEERTWNCICTRVVYPCARMMSPCSCNLFMKLCFSGGQLPELSYVFWRWHSLFVTGSTRGEETSKFSVLFFILRLSFGLILCW